MRTFFAFRFLGVHVKLAVRGEEVGVVVVSGGSVADFVVFGKECFDLGVGDRLRVWELESHDGVRLIPNAWV